MPAMYCIKEVESTGSNSNSTPHQNALRHKQHESTPLTGVGQMTGISGESRSFSCAS